MTPTESELFEQSVTRVLNVEKGFQKLAGDTGNWTGGAVGVGQLKGTKYGISAAAYPWLDIENLTVGEAKAIYRKDYWDLLKQAHPAVKFQFFDACVNHGPGNAKRILQRAVGVADDGKWGPVSQAALDKLDHNDALLLFISYRAAFFTKLKAFDQFGRGWTNRIAEMLLIAAKDN